MKLVFCNIGWMARYRGIKGQPDRIVGGGRYVVEHGEGGEVCNFLPCADGYVYGHVETLKGDPDHGGTDREIDITKLGAKPDGQYADGIDVVWTATHPTGGGRRVVGWHRDARVFRKRQRFSKFPSTQHRQDGLTSYIIRASSENVRLISLDDRNLRLESHKPGWMGHAQWWFPRPDRYKDVSTFIRHVVTAINPAGEPNGARERSSLHLGQIGPLERDFIRRLIRDRQPAFRKAVMHAYGGKCCLTGCTIPDCLEAAHIDRFSETGDDRVTNGILLRADLHRLLDAKLLTFRWFGDGEVLQTEVHQSVQDPAYRVLNDSEVRLPSSRLCWPAREKFPLASFIDAPRSGHTSESALPQA